MFNLFKKKKCKEDPILEALKKQTEELEEICNYFKSNSDRVEAEIEKAEKALKELGYTDEDLNRIKLKSVQ